MYIYFIVGQIHTAQTHDIGVSMHHPLSQPNLSSELPSKADPTLIDDDPTLLNLLSRIHVASHTLHVGTECRVTAMVILQRYYQQYTYLLVQYVDPNQTKTKLDIQQLIFNDIEQRHHLGIISVACLFLACKAENQHRRIRDVVNLCHMLDFTGSNWDNTPTLKHGPVVHIVEASSPPALDDHYWEAKQALVSAELTLLRFISYHVQVTHPHRILVLTLNHWFIPYDHIHPVHTQSSSHSIYSILLAKGWRILNDTLFYPPCLRLHVLNLVYASIQLAIYEYSREKQLDKDDPNWDTLLHRWTTSIITLCPTHDLDIALNVVHKAMSSL